MGANWSSSMVLPPGFGFHPSNEVLIKDYLRPKIMGKNVPEVDIFIPTIDDLCNSDPSELLSLCRRTWNPDHCYFFCKWKLYGKGARCDRKTKTGYWKKTGKELPIFDPDTHKRIGKRSILVFYEGRNPGKKTDYIMHVYEMNDDISHQSAPYVICRLHVDAKNKMKKMNNKVDAPSNMESEPSGKVSSDLEIQGEPAVIPENQFSNGLGERYPGSFSQSQDSSFFNGGEPSVNINSDGDVPLATANTPEEYDQAGVGFESVDSEPVYSSEGHHNGYVDTELSIAELISMFYVPQDGSEGTRVGVLNDQPTSTETAGFPYVIVTSDCQIPEAPGATQVNSHVVVDDISSPVQPLSSPDFDNEMIASSLFDDSELSILLSAFSDENLGASQSLDSL